MTAVTGVSGSGKSTLVYDILFKALENKLHKARQRVGAHERMEGIDGLDKVVAVDQKPIGRTPRSNPATYTGLFAALRDLMARTPEARARGYGSGPVQLQRRGRALRGVRGRRRQEDRDALPARRLRHLRPLRGQALQQGDPGRHLQGQDDRRLPGHDRGRRLRAPQGLPPAQAQAGHPEAGRARATSASASPRPPCPAGRPSASS